MLELTAVQKSFGSHTVIDLPGQIFHPGLTWLKGANGSGKSTLLYILAGLLPCKGNISNSGISLKKQPVHYRSAINHAPAEPVYPGFMTGDELIDFTLHVKKGRSSQVARVRELLDIGKYTANPSGSYSSGMLKKVSLLLAFLGEPNWILLDEPLTTLDIASQQSLIRLINEYRAQGCSFILTSHHDVETTGLSFDHIYTLSAGKLNSTQP